MPKFLEQRLKAEYPNNPRAVYGTLNNIGAMHGNKVTPKGEAMQAKHDAKMRGAAPKMAAPKMRLPAPNVAPKLAAPRAPMATGFKPSGPTGPRGSMAHASVHPGRNLGAFVHPRRGKA